MDELAGFPTMLPPLPITDGSFARSRSAKNKLCPTFCTAPLGGVAVELLAEAFARSPAPPPLRDLAGSVRTGVSERLFKFPVAVARPASAAGLVATSRNAEVSARRSGLVAASARLRLAGAASP